MVTERREGWRCRHTTPLHGAFTFFVPAAARQRLLGSVAERLQLLYRGVNQAVYVSPALMRHNAPVH